MPTSTVVKHPLVRLARIAVETYVREHRVLTPPYPLDPDQRQACGVFVSIVKDDTLRGSVGTLTPVQANLATEVIHNAIAAAVRDPRFSPVHPPELTDLHYVIDIINELEPLPTLAQQDPQQHGLVVRTPHQIGVVLPSVTGIDSASAQLALALRKAQLNEQHDYKLWRFCVQRLS